MMMVRLEMSKPEVLSNPVPSPRRTKEYPIEEIQDMGQVAEKIRQGQALLMIVVTPWGVEFGVVDRGVSP